MQTEEYGKLRAAEEHYWWFVSRRRLAHRYLARFHGEYTDLLDVGCGTGALIAETGGYGVDFSSEAMGHCMDRGLDRCVQGDAQCLPFLDGSTDVVVSLDTLEHVPDDERAMSEIFRVLRPGGSAVVNVPAFRWLWGPHDIALMHHRRYTARELKQKLERAGFQVRHVSYSVFFLFPIVLAIRVPDRFRRGPAQVRLPQVPRWLNAVLLVLQDFEGWLSTWVTLPWGSSIVAVATKK